MCNDCLTFTADDLAVLRARMKAAMADDDAHQYEWLKCPRTKQDVDRRACFYSHCVTTSTEDTLAGALGVWKNEIEATTPCTATTCYDTDGHEMHVVGTLGGQLVFAVGKKKRALLAYAASLQFGGCLARSGPLMPRLTEDAIHELIWRFCDTSKVAYENVQRSDMHMYHEVKRMLVDLVAAHLGCNKTIGAICGHMRAPCSLAHAWGETIHDPRVAELASKLGMSEVFAPFDVPLVQARPMYADSSDDLRVDSPVTEARDPAGLVVSSDFQSVHEAVEEIIRIELLGKAATDEKIRQMKEDHAKELRGWIKKEREARERLDEERAIHAAHVQQLRDVCDTERRTLKRAIEEARDDMNKRCMLDMNNDIKLLNQVIRDRKKALGLE